jgi:hypothetical protein
MDLAMGLLAMKEITVAVSMDSVVLERPIVTIMQFGARIVRILNHLHLPRLLKQNHHQLTRLY